MQMTAFNQGAVALARMVLPRHEIDRALVFETILTSGEDTRPVRFLVYRPCNYTQVLVDDDRARTWREDESILAPFRTIADHDSCWRDWYEYAGRLVTFQAQVVVVSVTLRTVVVDNERIFDQLLARLTRANQADLPFYPSEAEGLQAADWYGFVHEVFLRTMNATGRSNGLKSLRFEVWASSGAGRLRRCVLTYQIDGGFPVLHRIKYDRADERHRDGTGRISGDVHKLCWEHWKNPSDFDLNLGALTSCEENPWKGWGL